MLILHGVIFLGIFLALRKKRLERKIGLLMLCGNLLGMIVTAAGLLSGEQPLTELERKAGETREIHLEAEDAAGRRELVTLEIPELQYTPSETQELLQDKLRQLDSLILGENTSLTEVRSDLYLPADFGDSPVTVRWTSGDPGLLDSGGRLGEEIPEEGAEVELEGRLSLQKEELLYIRTLRVYPPEEQKDFSQKLLEEARLLNESGDGKTYRLPDTVDGQRVEWRLKKEKTGSYVAVLFLAAGILLTVSRKNLAWKEEQKLREEMKREYPEIVGRIQLLLARA